MPKMIVEEIATGFPVKPGEVGEAVADGEAKDARRVRVRSMPCSAAEVIRLRRAAGSADTALLSLREEDGDRRLPVFIGLREGREIARGLTGETCARPLTHDLLATVVSRMEGHVEQVTVCALKEGTFHALITIAGRGGRVEVDARPSDAVALAVRVNAPIYCEETVLEEAGQRWSADWEWDPACRPATILWPVSKAHG
jgi:bifunctional DNase/RNase